MSERSIIGDDGVRLVYDDFGPRDGVPMVLCHGLTMTGAQFRDTAAAFAARGYRVLAPDLRGHGRSGVPGRVSRTTFSLERFEADALAMLADAGLERVHWVGNSLGGIVGLRLLPAGRFLSLTTYGTAYCIGLHSVLTQAWVGLGFLLLSAGTKRVSATESALIGALDAPLAPLWVWLAFGETVGNATVIGGAIVVLAVAGDVLLANRPLRRKAHATG